MNNVSGMLEQRKKELEALKRQLMRRQKSIRQGHSESANAEGKHSITIGQKPLTDWEHI